MADVSQGAERARAWPSKRKQTLPPKTQAENEKFRQAQTATKYMAPQCMAACEQATRGTPLLPRDLATMILYNRIFAFVLEDGKTRYPLPFRNDVSESLDALGNTQGYTLIRGAEFWEAVPSAGGGALGAIIERPSTFTGSSSGQEYIIPFETETIDQNNFWDIAEPTRLYAPAEGWYIMQISHYWEASSGDTRRFRWHQNGARITSQSVTEAFQDSTQYQSVVAFSYANVGDYFEYSVYANATNRDYRDFRAVILKF